MTEGTTDKPKIVGKKVSELSEKDFKPYIGCYVAYKGGFENGGLVATEIIGVGETLDDCCKSMDRKTCGVGWIKLLEQDSWRNYDFLIGRKEMRG